MGLTPHQAAGELLAVAAAALGADAPATQYVALEMPPLDCELLVVAGFQLSLDEPAGDTGARVAGAGPRQTRFLMMLWYVDCVDAGATLDEATAAADAQRVLDRVWLVWRAVAGHAFGDCRPRSVGPAMAAATAGGLAGWRIPVEVVVD
jgi:hypothetical protein